MSQGSLRCRSRVQIWDQLVYLVGGGGWSQKVLIVEWGVRQRRKGCQQNHVWSNNHHWGNWSRIPLGNSRRQLRTPLRVILYTGWRCWLLIGWRVFLLAHYITSTTALSSSCAKHAPVARSFGPAVIMLGARLECWGGMARALPAGCSWVFLLPNQDILGFFTLLLNQWGPCAVPWPLRS